MKRLLPLLLLPVALVGIAATTYTITQLTANNSPSDGTLVEIYDPSASPKSGKYVLTNLARATPAGITNSLGYVPVNKAGDSMTGGLVVPFLTVGDTNSSAMSVFKHGTSSAMRIAGPDAIERGGGAYLTAFRQSDFSAGAGMVETNYPADQFLAVSTNGAQFAIRDTGVLLLSSNAGLTPGTTFNPTDFLVVGQGFGGNLVGGVYVTKQGRTNAWVPPSEAKNAPFGIIMPSGQNSYALIQRSATSDYCYVNWIGPGSASGANIQWAAGLLANQSYWNLWTWDGSSRVQRVSVQTTGDLSIGSGAQFSFSSTSSSDGSRDTGVARNSAGVLRVSDGSTGVGALIAKKVVEAKTADYSVVAVDSAKIFTNEGTTANRNNTLPGAAAGLTYTFIVQDADGLTVTAAAGDTIRVAASVTSAAGNISATTIGNVVTLTAINATEWIATSVVGTWTISP